MPSSGDNNDAEGDEDGEGTTVYTDNTDVLTRGTGNAAVTAKAIVTWPSLVQQRHVLE